MQRKVTTRPGTVVEKQTKAEIANREIETKHQQLEDERKLECKVGRTVLENDNIRSQSTGAREKQPLNWTPKQICASDWARYHNPQTSNQTTACIEATL